MEDCPRAGPLLVIPLAGALLGAIMVAAMFALTRL